MQLVAPAVVMAAQDAPLDLTGSPLMETENGRHVLKYTVECAMPGDFSAFARHNGELYQFTGDMGIAPSWRERPLIDEERAAVSACLLARTNAFGVSVSISLRTESEGIAKLPAFRTDTEERVHYDLWEGRFFGDILGDDPQAFACRGDNSPGAETLLLAHHRVCTLPLANTSEGMPAVSPCGFQVFASCDLPEARAALRRFGNLAVDVFLPSDATSSGAANRALLNNTKP